MGLSGCHSSQCFVSCLLCLPFLVRFIQSALPSSISCLFLANISCVFLQIPNFCQSGPSEIFLDHSCKFDITGVILFFTLEVTYYLRTIYICPNMDRQINKIRSFSRMTTQTFVNCCLILSAYEQFTGPWVSSSVSSVSEKSKTNFDTWNSPLSIYLLTKTQA